MQRSRYTHIVKPVFSYSQESTTGSLPYSPQVYNIIFTSGKPVPIIIRHSPWTTVRLVLNKVASENITDLFPSDWHPRPIMTTEDEKHYKVITELMTRMFQQCGYLQEENIIELENYQDFLKTYNTMYSWEIYLSHK